MAAPTFVGAGTGVAITGTSGTVNADIAGLATGDLLILQILDDAAGGVTIGTVVGIENLPGTDNAISSAYENKQVGASVVAYQHLFVGRRLAAGTPSAIVNTPGSDLYCRFYAFRGVITGTDIFENTSGSFGAAYSTGSTAAITDAIVTTAAADRLALNFVAVDDDNPLAAFAGMTGGTWQEAVAEFASATGTDGAIQLQTATTTAVINNIAAGGSDVDVQGAGGFNAKLGQSFLAVAGTLATVELRLRKAGPSPPTDNLIVEIQSDAAGEPSGTVLASSSIGGASLTTSHAEYSFALPATLAAGTYWIVLSRSGARDISNTFNWQNSSAAYSDGAGKVLNTATWSAAVPDCTFRVSILAAGTIDGGSQTMAAADNWGVIGFALKPLPSGPATLYGATSSAYTLNRVIAAQRRTTSNLARPITFGAVVAGIGVTPGVTHYGALAAPFAFNAVTAAQRRTTGATANPYTFAATTAAQRKTFGATATPLTFSKAVAGSKKTFGALAAPFTFAAVTAGQVTSGAVTHYGQLAAPFTFGEQTQATRKTFGQTATSITFGAVVASRKQYARVTAPFVFGSAITASKKTYGVVARPITFGAVTSGIGYTGAATYFGATAVQLTFSATTQAKKKTFGVVARPITFAAVVQGKRTTKGQVAAVYTWTATTQAKRKTHAQIAMPIQWLAVTRGVSTVGIQTYYGVVAAPFTFTATTVAQRRTAATISLPITISAFTKGMLMAAILNYADDIRWGSIQADRVMVGTEEVWTPGEDL